MYLNGIYFRISEKKYDHLYNNYPKVFVFLILEKTIGLNSTRINGIKQQV